MGLFGDFHKNSHAALTRASRKSETTGRYSGLLPFLSVKKYCLITLLKFLWLLKNNKCWSNPTLRSGVGIRLNVSLSSQLVQDQKELKE